MKGRHSGECKWDCGDVTKMMYSADTFDIVFDKACLDSILCQEGGTRLSQEYLKQVANLSASALVVKPHANHTWKQVLRSLILFPLSSLQQTQPKMQMLQSTMCTFALQGRIERIENTHAQTQTLTIALPQWRKPVAKVH